MRHYESRVQRIERHAPNTSKIAVLFPDATEEDRRRAANADRVIEIRFVKPEVVKTVAPRPANISPTTVAKVLQK